MKQNFVKECSLGSLLPLVTNRKKIEKLVNFYQNPNIPGFVGVDFVDRAIEYIHLYNRQNNKIFEEGLFRYCEGEKSSKLLGNRNGESMYALTSHNSGNIFYSNKLLVNGKWKSRTLIKFDPKSLIWSNCK